MNEDYERLNHLTETSYFDSFYDWESAIYDAKDFILEALGVEDFLNTIIANIGLDEASEIFDDIIRVGSLLYGLVDPDE